MSDPFFNNENSVFQILIQKNFELKIYFCPWKIKSIFLKKGNRTFSIKLGSRDAVVARRKVFKIIEIAEITFSTSCKKFKIFPLSYFLKKRQ